MKLVAESTKANVKMETEKHIESIIKEFTSILYKYIPKSMIIRHSYSANSFEAKLSEINSPFSESQYFYNGKKKFVHWTSVQNLMSILNYRKLRLYNLHNSSDSDEFKYSAKKLNLNDDQIEYAKKYLYTLSFCEAKEIENSNLWKTYGKDFKGVAIEFEILNEPSDWKNFMLSKVFYEIPNNFVELQKELESFNAKHNGASTFIDLGKLIAFHKKESFSKELEIRLSSYFPYKTREAYDTFCNTEFRFDKGRARITDYFGLKLWVKESPLIKSDSPEYDRSLKVKDGYFKEKPQIKITNIYFGKNCGISNQEFQPFWEKLQYIARIKLGYEITNLELNLYG